MSGRKLTPVGAVQPACLLILRSAERVSKDEATDRASWFETVLRTSSP
jgi:hypothetical protein